MVNNRVVIDTNVFISASIGQYSFPYKIFHELVVTDKVQICLSDALIREYESVMSRDKFKKIPQFVIKAQQLIHVLKSIGLMFEPQNNINFIPDEADNRILELAVTAKAKVIVTGNTKHFNFERFEGIIIQSPKDFYVSFQNEVY